MKAYIEELLPSITYMTILGLIVGVVFQVLIFYLKSSIYNLYRYTYDLESTPKTAFYRYGFLFLNKDEEIISEDTLGKYITITEQSMDELDSSVEFSSMKTFVLLLLAVFGLICGVFALIRSNTFLLGYMSIGLFFFAFSSSITDTTLRTFTLNRLRRDLLELTLIEYE